MRVNPNPAPGLLASIEQTQQQINTNLLQISSGLRINVPSDDPAGAAMLVQNASQTSQADQYLRSIGSIQGEMQNADSTLNSVVTALQRAISLGVEGANGTLSDTNRAAIATEVEGIQSQLLSLANNSYQGTFMFSGTKTQTAPYVLSNAPSGVSYAGNDLVNHVTVGHQLSLQSNLPGSQLFSATGHDMFQAVQDLITNLKSGNTAGVSTAVSEVSDAYNYIGEQRVFYGNMESQLNAQQTYLNSETTQLAQQQDNIGGADIAAAISHLTSSQTSLEATLTAMGHVAQDNLFDFLK